MDFEWLSDRNDWHNDDGKSSDSLRMDVTDFLALSNAAPDSDWRNAFDHWGANQPRQIRQFTAPNSIEGKPTILIVRHRNPQAE